MVNPVPLKDALLAVLVMLFWGVNFVVIDWGLHGVPPLVFVALRFALVVFPAVLFIPRPPVRWRSLMLVGSLMSLGQFGFLYTSLALGMPPGLASLVLQIQAAFTVLIAFLAIGERPRQHQVAGVILGMVGLGIVAAGRGGATPWAALLLSLGAAACWAAGNVASRRVGTASGLSMTVWSGTIVPVPMLALALVVNGPAEVGHAFAHLILANLASTAYTACLASLLGYGVWNSLLARHSASSVAPFSLLVPPVGIATAWLVQGERPTPLVLVGGIVLLAGVGWTSLGARLVARRPVPA
jgi:O-acetylserine/cysteine efflux transporter